MNDAEAVRLCQDGSLDAFRHLVERYQDVLYGTAYLMTSNGAIAEECVQESFFSAWRGIGGFRSGSPLKPWLVRILVNTVLDLRRRRNLPTDYVEEGASLLGEGDPAQQIVDRQAIRQALAVLPEEQRQVVMLKYFTDMTTSETAEALGCAEGTVKSRLYRALQHMKIELEK